MNVYSIHFSGVYPVGAVAVVVAADQEGAVHCFLQHIQKHATYLVKDNPKEKLEAHLIFYGSSENSPKCAILLDGEY